ncbi:MAG: thioredoxin family protein [Planctomycetaceae bacterium]
MNSLPPGRNEVPHRQRRRCLVLVNILPPLLLFASSLSNLFAQNFTCGTAHFAEQAEACRIRSALFWTDTELPGPWSTPCPILATPADHQGGGATSFQFRAGEVFGWRMEISGRREALLHDVIPHEVDHMVRATLVRRPITRWLDEGCAVLMESTASQQQHRSRAARFIHDEVTSSFLDDADYPTSATELDRLYAVGFSLSEYLLAKLGPQRLLAFQQDARPPTQKWEDFLGESPESTISHWRTAFLSTNTPQPVAPKAVADMDSHSPSSRPKLTIYTSQWCPPCRKFWTDFQNNPSFRQQLTSRYELIAIDTDRFPEFARQQRVESVPLFDLAGSRITGYLNQTDLLQQLDALAPPPPSPPSIRESPAETAVTPTPPAPPASFITPPTATAPTTIPPILPTPPTTPSPKSPPQKPPPNPTLSPSNGSRLLALLPTVWTALEWFGIVGGSAATGGIGGIVISFLWRRLRRRISQSPRNAQRHPNTKSTRPPLVTPDDVEIGGPSFSQAPFPRELDEAGELLRLRQSEGRVAALDALRGMFLDDEFEKLAQSSNPQEASIIQSLRTRINQRVDEVAPLSTRSE